MENPRKPPRLILKGLDILNLNDQNITRLGSLDFERTAQIMDLSQIDVLHIVRAVVVADLSTGPVDAFDLYNLAVLDCAAEGDCAWG